MIKAEEVILYLIPEAKNLMTVLQFENAVNAVKRYSEEAIKADRINLLNHVNLLQDGEKISNSFYLDAYDVYYKDTEVTIDEDSIINAPNIELL